MNQPPNMVSTIYAVVRLRDGRFAVEMTKPGQATVSVQPFWTEAEAQAWISVEKRRAGRDES
ncbi:MAG TPA: hypothetical protein VHQ39_15450 [Dongiaceae bacterium]|jgi:hypothetical protein|nr:hypothetical protein [Dongiaceae bacterium]